MNKFFKVLINILLLSLGTNIYIQSMLKNIKEVFSVVHKDYKHLSLVHGAIAWETGTIRRLYDDGQIFPVYKKDTRNRKIIATYENLEQTHKMVRLIHTLFYRIPASIGETDFGTTDQLQPQDPLTIVHTMAKILALYEDAQAKAPAFKNALESLATHKNLKDLAPKLEKNPLFITGKNNRFAWQLFIEQVDLYKKKNRLNYQQQIADAETIIKFCQNLNAIQNHFQHILKSHALVGAEMGQVMLGALHESSPHQTETLYPPHTVQMILLAFLYKKYSHDRAVLKSFYDTLNTQLDGKVLLHTLDDTWVKDNFEPVTQAEALKHFETILSAQDLNQSVNQNLAELIYYSQQFHRLPTPVGYARAIVHVPLAGEDNQRALAITDCMENTMRNFINLYAYDEQRNQFSLEKLQINMHSSTTHPALTTFLKNFDSPNMASYQAAHNAWITLISNIPYIAYNQVINVTTKQSTQALETGKGYITLPESDQTSELLKSLHTGEYQIFGKNQYGYELQPSIKNIIILLDHLLQLNLFSEEGGLSKEFIRPNFIKKYFPKLCKTLNATGFLSSHMNAQREELNRDFDDLDYSNSLIYTTFNLANIVTEFTTSSNHGELKVKSISDQKKLELKASQELSDFTNQPSASLLMTNITCKKCISFYHLRNNPEYLYINAFVAPLENTGQSSDMINQIFHSITIDTPLKIKTNLNDLLLRVAEKQPDAIQQRNMKQYILKSFIGKLNDEDIQNIDIKSTFKMAIKIAADAIADKHWDKQYALELFEILIIVSPNETKQIIQKILEDDNIALNKKTRLHKLLK